VATNLRLHPDAQSALRDEAERTGRSQQDIIREALNRYLDRAVTPHIRSGRRDRDEMVASGAVLAPRTPYRRVTPSNVAHAGARSLELLGRSDRL
jgi:hypothetical protein